jgi:hypothetical protein
MMCGIVEIREGALTRRARITAPSIERVPKVAGGGVPDHTIRLRFPIDSEIFFVPEDFRRREAA